MPAQYAVDKDGNRYVPVNGQWVPEDQAQAPAPQAQAPGIVFGQPRPAPAPTPLQLNADRREEERLRLAREAAARDANPLPSEAERNKAEKEARARAAMSADATSALDALQRSRGLIGGDVRLGTDVTGYGGWFNGETGILGSMFQGIPGTRAHDLQAQLARIKAVLSTGKMAEMRANSPTGGAVGNPAVAEWDMLANSVANLDLTQSPEQLRGQLDYVENHLRRLGGIPAAAPARPNAPAARPATRQPSAQERALTARFESDKQRIASLARQPRPGTPTRAPARSKPISEMSDAELQAIVNGR